MGVLQGLVREPGAMPSHDLEALATLAQSPAIAITVPKPVVAAINGACAGIGFVIALSCDVRFAAAGAKLTSSFVRRGLIAEHGLAWLLPRLVGTARALDFLLSGRVVLAEEALELGIVNRVLPGDSLLAATEAYARELAIYSSPASMAAIKRQVYRAMDIDFTTAHQEAVRLAVMTPVPKSDFAEGVASFVEKREPRFEPLSADLEDPFG